MTQSDQAYCDQLVDCPDMLLVRCEDRLANFEPWIDRIVTFCEFESTRDVIRAIRTVREPISFGREFLECLAYPVEGLVETHVVGDGAGRGATGPGPSECAP